MEARAPICHVRLECPVPRREVGSASHTGPHRRLTDPPRERNRHEDLRHRSDRVLGRRAVSQLVAAGVEVTGVARSREKAVELRDLGAAPVEVSLFDTDQLTAAIAGHEAVCNLATAIPTGDRTATRSAWNENHAIRRDGARNLVDAAIHAGADRYIQESNSFLYADGADEYLDESAPADPTWITESALAAEGEAARFAGHGGVGSPFASASSTVPTASTRSMRSRPPSAASSRYRDPRAPTCRR